MLLTFSQLTLDLFPSPKVHHRWLITDGTKCGVHLLHCSHTHFSPSDSVESGGSNPSLFFSFSFNPGSLKPCAVSTPSSRYGFSASCCFPSPGASVFLYMPSRWGLYQVCLQRCEVWAKVFPSQIGSIKYLPPQIMNFYNPSVGSTGFETFKTSAPILLSPKASLERRDPKGP